MKTLYFSIFFISTSFLIQSQSFEQGIPPSLDTINVGLRKHEFVDKRFLPSIDIENLVKKKNECIEWKYNMDYR